MTRSIGFAMLASVVLSGGLLAQEQQAPVPDGPDTPLVPQGGLQGKPPLTEEELREQRIRAVDPLAKPEAEDNAQKAADPARTSKPLRGSVAAGSRKPLNAALGEGPTVQGDEPEVNGPEQYVGPAVLSRAYTLNRPSVSEVVRWTPSVTVGAIYQGGLTGGAVSPGGVLDNRSSMGTTVGWGLTGVHRWRHDQLHLDYQGGANQYTGASAYNGTNHSLSVELAHVVSRHLVLQLTGSAAAFSQSYTLSNPALSIDSSVANVNLAASPLVQILDTGTRQASVTASMVWQKSARMSFNISGGTFGVLRQAATLIGNTGYTSSADMNYRYTRKTTLGVYYSFSDFVFSHRIQVANTHTVGLIYSYAFSRSLELRTRFGGTQIESEGLTTIPIAPSIAALLGQNSVIIEAYSKHRTSDVSAEIAKDLGRRRTARISYARGVSPGNGVQLTSLQESATAGFSMTVLRRNTIDIGGGRMSLSSAGQSIGNYTSNFVSIGVSHQYPRGLTQSFTAYYRTFDITNTMVNHPQLMINLSIGWSPGENPIHF